MRSSRSVHGSLGHEPWPRAVTSPESGTPTSWTARSTVSPGTWEGWTRAMEALVRVSGSGHYAIFLPTNEYTPWIIFGLQAGSPMLRDRDTRGAFSGPAYRRALSFSLDLFHRGLAPPIQGASIANV